MCDFFFREIPKQVGIRSFFGILNDDRRSAQPSCCYDTFGWMDFPTGVVIKNQTFPFVLLVAQPMFLTNSLIERHASGGVTFSAISCPITIACQEGIDVCDGFPASVPGGTVMLFRQLHSVRVFALSLVLRRYFG
jgi:hypothetical protein